MEMINAEFVSVWDDCIEIRSNCIVDVETCLIHDIEVVNTDGMDLDACTDEYVEIDGDRYKVKWDECDDCYYVISGR